MTTHSGYLKLANGSTIHLDGTSESEVLRGLGQIVMAELQGPGALTLDAYQRDASRTNGPLHDGDGDAALFAAVTLGSEAGEVLGLFQKHLWQGHELDLEKVIRELGDVLWGVSQVAAALGIPLSTVATANIAKLRARYPEGFEAARSVSRAPGDD